MKAKPSEEILIKGTVREVRLLENETEIYMVEVQTKNGKQSLWFRSDGIETSNDDETEFMSSFHKDVIYPRHSYMFVECKKCGAELGPYSEIYEKYTCCPFCGRKVKEC